MNGEESVEINSNEGNYLDNTNNLDTQIEIENDPFKSANINNDFSNSYNQIFLIQNQNNQSRQQSNLLQNNLGAPKSFQDNDCGNLNSSFFEFEHPMPNQSFENNHNHNSSLLKRMDNLENENKRLKRQLEEMQRKEMIPDYSRFIYPPFQEEPLFYFITHPRNKEFSLRNGKIEQISKRMELMFGRDLSQYLGTNTSQFFVKLSPNIIKKRAEVGNFFFFYSFHNFSE